MKARNVIVAVCLLIASVLTWLLLFQETPPPLAEPAASGSSETTRLLGSLDPTVEQTVRDSSGQADRAPVDVAPPRETGDLEVHVLWRDDRSPVPNFTLRVGRTMMDGFSPDTRKVRTDAAGIAELTNLDPGTWWLYATRDAMTPVEAVAAETREVEFLLERRGQIRVRVMDQAGDPIPGADVHIANGWLLANSHLGQTDGDGRLEFHAMAPNVSVFATKEGRGQSQPAEVVSFPGDPVDVLLTLGEDARELTGLVTDEAGHPVAGAEVTVTVPHAKPRSFLFELSNPEDDRSRPVVTTGGDGRFHLSNVLPGSFSFDVRAPGFAPKSVTDVVEDGTEEITLVLESGAQVVGVVRDAEGRPVHHATVYAGTAFRLLTRTDDQGRFGLRSLSPGTVRLSAVHPERGVANGELEVLAGETRTWEPRLDGGVIEGQISSERGEPMAGLSVMIMGRRLMMEPRVPTSQDGLFRAVVPADDLYQITVRQTSSISAQVLARVTDLRPGSDPVSIVIRDTDLPSAYLEGRMVRPPGFEDHLVRLDVSTDRPGADVMHGVGPDGTFRIGPLIPGTYTITPIEYQTPLAGFRIPQVELGPDETVDLGTIQISPPTWLDLHIRCRDGSQVRESAVSLFDLERQRWVRWINRWILGSMRPDSYEPGRYRLELFGLHHLPWSREIELVEGQTTAVEATVERARPCTISLVPPTGVAAPETLQIALRRQGPKDERVTHLYNGQRLIPVGLGTYVAEIQDADSPLHGSVRFTVSSLDGSDLRIELVAR